MLPGNQGRHCSRQIGIGSEKELSLHKTKCKGDGDANLLFGGHLQLPHYRQRKENDDNILNRVYHVQCDDSKLSLTDVPTASRDGLVPAIIYWLAESQDGAQTADPEQNHDDSAAIGPPPKDSPLKYLNVKQEDRQAERRCATRPEEMRSKKSLDC